MKIEEGKYYKTRDGRKIGPMVLSSCDDGYPYHTPVWNGWWSTDGERQSREHDETDLTSEWFDGIQVGKVYNTKYKESFLCIAICGEYAYMRDDECDYATAYVWEASTGKSVCLGTKYDVDLTPAPVVDNRTGTVTFTDGVPDFDTWRETE